MLHKMPVILLIMMVVAFFAVPYLPLELMSQLYSLSLFLKGLIVFTLPTLIFCLLFKTTVQMSQQASGVIVLILLLICISNFISTMVSYGIGGFFCSFNTENSLEAASQGALLEAGWYFNFPKWIANDKAMFLGIILGLVFGKCLPKPSESLSKCFDLFVQRILNVFFFIIPIFIFGFLIKMVHDGILTTIVVHYARIFTLVALLVYSYIALLYLIASGFKLKLFFKYVLNMLPAALTGFGSMSSAAAMPVTILATEKNAKNRALAGSIIPATVNIHLIGDCFAIPIFALAILKSSGLSEPAMASYLLFAFQFVIQKFSVAGVPGGGIIVMLPVLENHLGLDSGMLSLITALYILFDPVITSANVMGNGAFALLLERLFSKQISNT